MLGRQECLNAMVHLNCTFVCSKHSHIFYLLVILTTLLLVIIITQYCNWSWEPKVTGSARLVSFTEFKGTCVQVCTGLQSLWVYGRGEISTRLFGFVACSHSAMLYLQLSTKTDSAPSSLSGTMSAFLHLSTLFGFVQSLRKEHGKSMEAHHASLPPAHLRPYFYIRVSDFLVRRRYAIQCANPPIQPMR